MDPLPRDLPAIPSPSTPEAHLDALRDHPEWDERRRAEELDRLVRAFPPARLLGAVRDRLGDLRGGDAETLLRLVESHATPELLGELAEALIAQEDLAPERAWEALSLLEARGMLDEYPVLFERWQDLNEALLDEQGAFLDLAEGLEGDPDGIWLALQGLGPVEPEVRAEIVASLATAPFGPGLVEFLRLLSYVHEPITRAAALDALESLPRDEPSVLEAWASIASDPPEPSAEGRARRLIRAGWRSSGEANAPALPPPRIVRSLVTALDGQGRGFVVLSTASGGSVTTAAYQCDVLGGVLEAVGQTTAHASEAEAVYAEVADRPDREWVEGASELALGLLAGGLLLCGPGSSPALRYWLERTVGARFRPRAVSAPFAGWDPASLPFDETPGRVRMVLDSCPSWYDDSRLTYDLAEEIALREGGSVPDPRRDAGAYRYLFEHRLVGQLELYRRMLFWMASFWEAAGDPDRGQSALALAWQLSDPQHAVPAHPFTVALTTRSFVMAQENLRAGIDPRRGPMDA